MFLHSNSPAWRRVGTVGTEQLIHGGGGALWPLFEKRGGDLFTFFNALMHLQQALMLSRALDQQINIELCDLPR